MTTSTGSSVCSSVPEIRVLGMGIGFFLYLLLVLLTISVLLASHDKKKVGKQFGIYHAVFLLLVIVMPKKKTTVVECGPRTDSQGLLTDVMTIVQGLSGLLGLLGVMLHIGLKPVFTIGREDRATGHTTAVFFS
ncbi:unnamed protein product [Amoebophrya sp. A25]|nr:unnamed protein product [Amoebophrya sp. A25]|eukprot:GSA25T00025760001.1